MAPGCPCPGWRGPARTRRPTCPRTLVGPVLRTEGWTPSWGVYALVCVWGPGLPPNHLHVCRFWSETGFLCGHCYGLSCVPTKVMSKS